MRCIVAPSPLTACCSIDGLFDVLQREADGYIFMTKLLKDMKSRGMIDFKQTPRSILDTSHAKRAAALLKATVADPAVRVRGGSQELIGVYVHIEFAKALFKVLSNRVYVKLELSAFTSQVKPIPALVVSREADDNDDDYEVSAFYHYLHLQSVRTLMLVRFSLL
jgi:hypothetical protein